jgi:eukaryotic-like serine/threonine-protein kinase
MKSAKRTAHTTLPPNTSKVAEFWPQYVRGLAYLSLKSANEASAEFHRILDHRGEATLSVLYPLARLALARAIALTGDTEKSRKEYQSFFELWKNADADLPILIEAKQRFQLLTYQQTLFASLTLVGR